jgi:hypothetical protein
VVQQVEDQELVLLESLPLNRKASTAPCGRGAEVMRRTGCIRGGRKRKPGTLAPLISIAALRIIWRIAASD